MKEIEILVKVLDNKQKALSVLDSYKKVGIKKITDTYFFNSERNELQPDQSGRLTRCLRLRKKENKNFLAYKIDYFNEKGVWLYSDEHETEVADFETMMVILRHLGLEILVEIKNKKHIYLTDKYEIVLEEVENLGLFLEVECLGQVEDDKVLDVKNEIWKFIKSLKMVTEEESNAGKPELMIRKGLGKF